MMYTRLLHFVTVKGLENSPSSRNGQAFYHRIFVHLQETGKYKKKGKRKVQGVKLCSIFQRPSQITVRGICTDKGRVASTFFS